MSVSKVKSSLLPGTLWEAYSPKASRDLILKKIAVVVVAALNLAILGVASYYAIAHLPILPSQVQALWLCSPFILGVLAALAYMKIPGCSTLSQTCGSNPVLFLGKVFTYLFFGPLVYVSKQIDWTAYHDPFVARDISTALKTLTFDKLADKYGKNFDNLIKYGFIGEEYQNEVAELYTIYLVAKETRDFYKNENAEDDPAHLEAVGQIEEVNARWEVVKKEMKYPFPDPARPKLDFSKKSTKFKVGARQIFVVGAPVDILQAK